jgi:hypothetical protein
MTDARTGPGAGTEGAAADDSKKQHTVAPTPPETTERAAEGETAGRGTAGRETPGRETPGRAAEGREAAPGNDRAKGIAQGMTKGRTGSPTAPEATSGEGASRDPSRDPHATGTRLFPHDEGDKLELRLRQAVSGFVDGPRDAVEEADHVLEEIAGRFTEAVNRRRRTLRVSWQQGNERSGAQATHPDTEQLRLALRDYRELAERLLHG